MIGRRRFLQGLTATLGAAAGTRVEVVAAEAPPEVTRIRLMRMMLPAICLAPNYVAGELLRAEGFTDVEYVTLQTAGEAVNALGAGRLDIAVVVAPQFPVLVDGGASAVVVAGLHGGCYELFATGPVRSLHDLRGKRVSMHGRNTGTHAFLVSMLSHVGLDPNRDVTFVPLSSADGMRALREGSTAAFLAFPPENQELRAAGVGRVIVNTGADRPWSQYFCCMLAASRDFLNRHPVATKRALRAILKANEMCAAEPDRVARLLVDGGFAKPSEHLVPALRELPYRRWRDSEPDDSVRFYALRLHEAGLVKSTPKRILADAVDLRIWRELKRELRV